MIKTVLGDTLLCAGCRACEQVCAVHAISMVPSDEGFLYPHINPETCVGCGRCGRYVPRTISRSTGSLWKYTPPFTGMSGF